MPFIILFYTFIISYKFFPLNVCKKDNNVYYYETKSFKLSSGIDLWSPSFRNFLNEVIISSGGRGKFIHENDELLN